MLSPAASKDGPRQSHVPVKRFSRRVANLSIPDIDVHAVRRYKPFDTRPTQRNIPKLAENTFRSGDAKRLAKGTYGSVYIIRPTHTAHDAIASLFARASNRIGSWTPTSAHGRGYILKLSVQDEETAETWPAFLKRSTRENAAHMYVHRHAPDIVPALHFAGALENGIYVTVMDVAAGVTLKEYVKQHGGISSRLYNALEKAIVRMWQLGIVHGDLHDENVMVASDRVVTIIDFGFAVMLPGELRAAIDSDLHRRDVPAAWAKIQAYVDAVQLQRIEGLEWYNPNAKALQHWYTYVKNRGGTPTSVLTFSAGSSRTSGSATSQTSVKRHSGVASRVAQRRRG